MLGTQKFSRVCCAPLHSGMALNSLNQPSLVDVHWGLRPVMALFAGRSASPFWFCRYIISVKYGGATQPNIAGLLFSWLSWHTFRVIPKEGMGWSIGLS